MLAQKRRDSRFWFSLWNPLGSLFWRRIVETRGPPVGFHVSGWEGTAGFDITCLFPAQHGVRGCTKRSACPWLRLQYRVCQAVDSTGKHALRGLANCASVGYHGPSSWDWGWDRISELRRSKRGSRRFWRPDIASLEGFPACSFGLFPVALKSSPPSVWWFPLRFSVLPFPFKSNHRRDAPKTEMNGFPLVSLQLHKMHPSPAGRSRRHIRHLPSAEPVAVGARFAPGDGSCNKHAEATESGLVA